MDSREAEKTKPVDTAQTHLQSPLYLPQIQEHLSLLSLCTALLRMAATSAMQGVVERLALPKLAREGLTGGLTLMHASLMFDLAFPSHSPMGDWLARVTHRIKKSSFWLKCQAER